MRVLSFQELNSVSGGQALNEAELSNAYMMSGSVALPIIANGLFASYGTSMIGSSLIKNMVSAGIAGVATGVGVWLGYQIYYGLYGS